MKIFRIIVLTLAAIISVSGAYAQLKVTGVVTDIKKQPIIGATVIVTGTTNGITTDVKGHFTIMLPEGKNELTLNYIGYNPLTIPVNKQSRLEITLHESSEEIEEVVVVGFGTMRKSDMTGSVASVKINELEASQAGSFDRLLQGRAAGVQVTTGNAAPGGAIDIRIRGNSSFNSGGEPLYVVDGIIMNPPTQDTANALTSGKDGGGTQDRQNGLMGINPSDIANMEILKDASATAIYGAMGANGVVLITTKSATSDRPKVEVSTNFEFSSVRKKIDLLGFDDFQKYLYERDSKADLNWNEYIPTTPEEMNVSAVDWQDYCMETSFSQRHRVSVSGRTKTASYYIAAGYADNKGVIKQTNSQQTDVRINLDKSLGKYIKIGTKTTFAYIKNNMTQGTDANGTSNSSMIRSMLGYKPYINFQSLGGSEDQEDPEAIDVSPVTWFNDYNDFSREYRVTPAIFAEAKLFPWLTYKLSTGADIRNKTRTKWRGRTITTTGNGMSGVATLNAFRYNIDNMFMFNKTFGQNHRLSGTIGSTINYAQSTDMTTEGYNINENVGQAGNINSAGTQLPSSYGETKYTLSSYLARVVYSFKDKYVITATYRIDGSSKFAKGNQYSYFPSVALAWRMTEEKFLHLPEFVSTAKLRAGWGKVGNQGLSPYQTTRNYNSVIYPDHDLQSGYITGVAPVNISNPSLKWETTEQINAGIDLGFIDNRINFTLDVYNKDTKDLLQKIYTAPSASLSTNFSTWINRGEINNKGLEMAIDATPIVTRDFTWSISANISFNRNKITDIGLPPLTDGSSAYFYGSDIGRANYFKQPANIFYNGSPMGLFYGWQTDGIVQIPEGADAVTKINGIQVMGKDVYPGDVNFIDQNGDGQVDMNDRIIIGDPNNKFSYGFNTGFTYKGISLDLNFNGVYGGQIINANRMMEDDVIRGKNVRADVYHNAWRPDSPSNKYPRLYSMVSGNNTIGYLSDRIVEDASFLRLSNITLSYSIPLKNQSWLKALNVNVSAKNLLTITNYSGYDPEVSSFTNDMFKMGVDLSSYPNYKSFSFGISATF